MQLGVIGLGRMGGNIVRRLTRAGHDCVVFDQNAATVKALVGDKVQGGQNLADLVKKLGKPRAVWVMLPAGEITENTVNELGSLLERGDTIIDGGNAFFHDDVRRARAMKQKGIHYVDCGTSGGVWGLQRGYCLMIGGEKEVVDRLDPIFATLAPGEGNIDKTPHREKRDPRVERGYLYCGPSGSGRFVKMVHNGIEYGIMQAYAEGFEIMQKAASEEVPEERRYTLDLADIAEVWRRGSVISSWLLDLTAMSLAEDPALSKFSGVVEDSGEGRWTVNAAIEEAVPADVLSAALFARFRSRDKEGTANKLLSAMRHAFGGHVEPK
ncbi:phosphogluconate dehydrogenase (NAD(+)-dependent, decarboxylating) [Enhydrobacter sp.]|jgi:6-phosphogluconate dehydrogenase|uniref:phosphogluconate dehydrogenase (NAD(+)-dependent, decarboxylating) n=1 Tax=Enhydrobacter sp. TaxID=1894999 RepID=UPI00262EAD3A|nr:decarboxylating 6-phosphogluconate dehydrogenase [Enhydrobacter sp.]WIM12634.1 MAG: 6-phosphogluconate dehydrogenase, decarboxylating [Enhydrobacter sp.]